MIPSAAWQWFRTRMAVKPGNRRKRIALVRMGLKQQLSSKIESAVWPGPPDGNMARFERPKPRASDPGPAGGSEDPVQIGTEYDPYPFLAYNFRQPVLTPLDQVALARLGEVVLLRWDELPEAVRTALVKAAQCTQTDAQPHKVKEKLAALQHDAPPSSQ